MPLVPLDNSHVVASIVSDATYLRSFLNWASQRYSSYNQMLTTDAMTAASISSDDQAFVLAFIGDLNRIITLAGGSVPSNADDMHYNCNALLGLQQ